jgi:hypothetical protein
LPAKTGLSARRAAKALGVTHPTLLTAVQKGRISREPDGSYDVTKVRTQLGATANKAKSRKSRKHSESHLGVVNGVVGEAVHVPVAKGNKIDGQNRTFAEAQRLREWLRVERDRLELLRKRSELVPIAEINAFVAGMIIRAREILVRIAPELKDHLAQTANPHECEKLVAGEVARALNELAEYRPGR